MTCFCLPLKVYLIRLTSFILLIVLLLACKKPNEVVPPVLEPKIKSFTEGAYTLIITNNDGSVNTTIRDKMVKVFFQVYPKLVNRFNPQAPTTVYFIIDPTYTGVAYATGGATVYYSANYLKSNPNDIDVVTHEVMHVVQAYANGLGWLTEGLADYARFTYGIDNTAANWALPPYAPGQNYTDSYRVTARFLVWLDKKYSPAVINELDANLRAGTYQADVWVKLTGKTLNDLWLNYSQNPTW